MDIEKCKSCKHFGTMFVALDTRRYPRCAKNRNKATWDVKETECVYEKYDGVLANRRL